jgi:hypothetical protein
MEPQVPATSIAKTGEFKDASIFQVVCDCNSPDHSVNMWIEVDPETEFKLISVNFYAETYSNYKTNWAARLKIIWDVLTQGYYKQESSLMLNEQAAVNFAHTILREVDKFKG